MGQERAAENWPISVPGEPRDRASATEPSELKRVGLSAKWIEEMLRE